MKVLEGIAISSWYPFLEGLVGNAAGRASRYSFWILRSEISIYYPTTTMANEQDFSIKVQAEDPKKKDKPENDKPEAGSSAKPVKDAKGEKEGEELVRFYLLRCYGLHSKGSK